MTRKKVVVEYIPNDAARKNTLKKRKKGMMKKVQELSTLCGINACAVVFSPTETHPEAWPDASGAHQVLAQFRALPEMEQTKKMVSQISFTQQRISKVNESLAKEDKELKQRQNAAALDQFLTFGGGASNPPGLDLKVLGPILDGQMSKIKEWVDSLKPNKQVAGDMYELPKPEPPQQQLQFGVPPPFPQMAPPPPLFPQMAPPPPSMSGNLQEWMNNADEQPPNMGFGHWAGGFFPGGN